MLQLVTATTTAGVNISPVNKEQFVFSSVSRIHLKLQQHLYASMASSKMTRPSSASEIVKYASIT
jgi:hypothetical protein